MKPLTSFLLVLLSVCSLQAAPLRFNFTGHITSVDAALGGAGGFSVNDPVSYAFTLNPETDLIMSNSDIAFFQVTSFEGSFGGYELASPTGSIYFFHNAYREFGGMQAEHNGEPGAAVNGYALSDTYLEVTFPNAFTALPVTAEQLLRLDTAAASNANSSPGQASSLSFDFSPNYKYVNFKITDATVAVIPEPSTWALLSLAGAVLVFATQAKTRRHAKLS